MLRLWFKPPYVFGPIRSIFLDFEECPKNDEMSLHEDKIPLDKTATRGFTTK